MRYYTKTMRNTQLLAVSFFLCLGQAYATLHHIQIENATNKKIEVTNIIPNGTINPQIDHLAATSVTALTAETTSNMPLRAVIKLWEYDIDIAFFNHQVRILNCEYSPFNCSFTSTENTTTVKISEK